MPPRIWRSVHCALLYVLDRTRKSVDLHANTQPVGTAVQEEAPVATAAEPRPLNRALEEELAQHSASW